MLNVAQFLLIGILAVSTIAKTGNPNEPRSPKGIIGTVVLRDTLHQLFRMTYHDSSYDRFVVRAQDPKAFGSEFVIVTYKRWLSEPHLPDNLFDSNRKWRLPVSPSPCGGTTIAAMVNGLAQLRRTTPQEALREMRVAGAESVELPLDTVLPCYEISPKDLGDLRELE
jgi:hypothetical protein